MGTSLLSATPRKKGVEHGRVRQIHTYFTFFQLSWTSPATDILLWSSSHCFFVFFFLLWIQTGFEAKAAFDPSRFVNLPTNLPTSTSNFTKTQRWSSTPFIRFQRCSITETGRWKEIFFHEQKIEKRFAGPEIKMPYMRTSVLQPL